MVKVEIKKYIIEQFYTNHEKPNIIAKELNVNPSYITKVIRKDDRYIKEKEYRISISKENRKISKRNWIKSKRDEKKQLKAFVREQHLQASKELSYKTELSDLAFARWNRNMFVYNKNSSDLVLNRKLKCSADAPKRVSNVVNANSIRSKKIYI